MNIHNINVISRYEIKLVGRSWLFRIFAFIALIGITGFIWIDLSIGFAGDTLLPSFTPFNATFAYSFAQSMIATFLAGNFLKRDKKLDTAEVIYVRPMSNSDYVYGKTLGIVQIFLALNIVVMIIAAIAGCLVGGADFRLTPFLTYIFGISIPALIFVLGLSFVLMCILKNQAITFIVVLGLIGLMFAYAPDYYDGVFDFFGLNIPSILSDELGLADLKFFLIQRLSFLFIGIGLITLTVGLVGRLPHKPWKSKVVKIVGSAIILLGILGMFVIILQHHSVVNKRLTYAKTYTSFSNLPKIDIVNQDINLQYATSDIIVKCDILATSDTSINKIILYLNPYLKVSEVNVGGKPAKFERENQVIIIDGSLQQGDTTLININYKGDIDEDICYNDVSDEQFFNTKINDKNRRYGHRYAYLTKDYVLLTPEAMWYPTSYSPTNPDMPYNLGKDFVRYNLSVSGQREGQMVISQGLLKTENGTTSFSNTTDLPSISLIIGDYEKKSVVANYVNFEIYNFKGHDFYSEYFTLIKDTIAPVLEEALEDIERDKGEIYQYSNFTVIETPIHFASFIRNWKANTEYIQPSIVFFPEWGADLTYDLKQNKEELMHGSGWRRNQNMDDNEASLELLKGVINNIFRSETTRSPFNWEKTSVNRMNISPMFLGMTRFIKSDRYPIFDICLNNVLNSLSSTQGNMRNFWQQAISDKQRANLYLEGHSLEDATKDKNFKAEVFLELVKLKSNAIKNFLLTSIEQDEITTFLTKFYGGKSFTCFKLEDLVDSLDNTYGLDFNTFLKEWYTIRKTPALILRDVDANQTIVDEHTKYQIKFKIMNLSDVNAIITTSYMTGGGNGGNGGRGGGGFNFSADNTNNYIIEGGKAYEIKIISDDRPANLTVETNISHNLPSLINNSFSKIETFTNDTTSGIKEVDISAFANDPNEIVIDNEDDGFVLIASNNKTKLKELLRGSEENEEKYNNFNPWWWPSKWTAIASDYCYGETVRSAVYKKSGTGSNLAQWTAVMPKDGYYDISVWNPKQQFGGGRRRQEEKREQTYNISYDGTNEVFTLDLSSENAGWVSFGNFYLSRDTVKITLSDKMDSQYVIADAIKFTKSKE